MIITGIHTPAIQRARMLAQGIAPLTLGKWVSERSLSYRQCRAWLLDYAKLDTEADFLQQCAICSTASCDDAAEEEPEVLEQVVPQATRVELGKRLRRIKLRHRYGCGPATVELELADTSTWPIKTNASMIVQVLT